MQNLAKMTSQLAHQQRTGQFQASPSDPKSTATLDPTATQHVNDIFRALQAAFPAWRTAFPDNASLRAAKASWVKGLMAAGVTDFNQIARGVEKARLSESDFFPSVGKFVGWCRLSPEDMGLPPEDTAWSEACQHSHHVFIHSWSHPGVYEAGRRVGWFDIRICSGERRLHGLRKAFSAHYAAVLQEIGQGKEFVMPKPDPDKLEHHTSGRQLVTEESRKAGRKAMAALRGSVGL